MKIKKINKKGALALSQVFLLLVSIVAVSLAIGSQIGGVEGAAQPKGGDCFIQRRDDLRKKGSPDEIKGILVFQYVGSKSLWKFKSYHWPEEIFLGAFQDSEKDMKKTHDAIWNNVGSPNLCDALIGFIDKNPCFAEDNKKYTYAIIKFSNAGAWLEDGNLYEEGKMDDLTKRWIDLGKPVGEDDKCKKVKEKKGGIEGPPEIGKGFIIEDFGGGKDAHVVFTKGSKWYYTRSLGEDWVVFEDPENNAAKTGWEEEITSADIIDFKNNPPSEININGIRTLIGLAEVEKECKEGANIDYDLGEGVQTYICRKLVKEGYEEGQLAWMWKISATHPYHFVKPGSKDSDKINLAWQEKEAKRKAEQKNDQGHTNDPANGIKEDGKDEPEYEILTSIAAATAAGAGLTDYQSVLNFLNKDRKGEKLTKDSYIQIGNREPKQIKDLALAEIKDMKKEGLKVVKKGTTVIPPLGTTSKKYLTGAGWLDKFLGEGLEKSGELKFANLVGHFGKGFIWGQAVRNGIIASRPFLEDFLGVEEEKIAALEPASIAGIWAGKTAYGVFKDQGYLRGIWGKETSWLWSPTSLSIGIGLGVAIWAYYNAYEKDEIEIHTFTCYPWEAPIRGRNCEECNNQGDFPCTEYQCKSLGQACELLNPGTGDEKCVWVNRDDVNPPELDVLASALLRDYAYNPTGIQFPNQNDRGVKIDYLLSDDKCVPAFTPLSFGVELDEPAKCKIDVLRKDSFESMSFYLSNSLSAYEHSYAMSLPSLAALNENNITIQNDGEYNLYVRCMDANGNFNIGNFVFNFCVDPGPDTTPPLIVGNTVGNKAFMTEVPIRYNQTSMNIDVYVNEPAECKWSHRDQNFETMEEDLACPQVQSIVNLQSVYDCSTTLTGLKDRFNNEFYFRCKDSSDNVNGESYKLTLVGTQPLVIDSAGPNATTLKDSTDVVKVTLDALTSAGYKDGEATCYYSETGREDDYIQFFYDQGTSSYVHSQELWLVGNTEGQDYTYHIKCEDFGGNLDYQTLDFSVQTDLRAPTVIRAYHEENYLKIVTDEKSDCVYDIVDCGYNFDEGITMTSIADTSHFTTWDTNKEFYVKCGDNFGNLPDPDQCSIIVKPSEI